MGVFSRAVDMMRVKWQLMTVKARVEKGQKDLQFCYDMLQHVSRSFAMVILQLKDQSLRDGICIFYLVLRALDTVEDDMQVPLESKLRELPKFHLHLLDDAWCMSGVGKGSERTLLEQFPRLAREYRALRPAYQEVISDICEQMANGMCDFLRRPVITTADYDLYCHYVAGLVGHGLSRLFVSGGFEDAVVAEELDRANEMGLFLQKTNIIRDYYEDIQELPPRMFWPQEIWGRYVPALADLADPAKQTAALRCLNAMVANAMTHVPAVLDYMASLHEPSVFRFCALPQVMAIATLVRVYNEPATFHTKVKISRPEACHIMVHATNLYDALRLFDDYCMAFEQKLDGYDASTPRLQEQLDVIRDKIARYMASCMPVPYTRSLLVRYPALGGQLLLSMVDSIVSFFGVNGNGGAGGNGLNGVRAVQVR